MICIGGVCIPYSALWPLLLLFLKPLLQYLFPTLYAKKDNDVDLKNKKMTIPTAQEETNKVYKDGEVIEIELESEFSTLLKTSKLVVIKFTASWCGPCKKIQPMYEDLAKHSETGIKFLVVDVDKLENVASEWDALRIPFFVTVKNGEKVDSAVTTSEEKLTQMIQSLVSS